MNAFSAKNTREFIRNRLKTYPKAGRGQLAKIAKSLKIHTTLMSQILRGDRFFTPDQALAVTKFFGLSSIETEFFLMLLQLEKSYTEEYRDYALKRLEQIKTESLNISNRMSYDRKLSEEERSIFYSSWVYSAAHLFCSLKKNGVTAEETAIRLNVENTRAAEILNFLLSCGLCTASNGRYKINIQSTFIERGSPHLVKHHLNWRLKAMQKAEHLKDSEMMFTTQFSISRKDFGEIREALVRLISNTAKTVEHSPPEEMACMHLDLFWLE